MDPRIDLVLDFWFGELQQGGPVEGSSKLTLWWGKDPAVDQAVRDELLELHLAAARGELEAWRDSPEGCVALVVLLDQVPRNAWRDTAHAFATDVHARAITRHALDLGLDAGLPLILRTFLYMPLMHSEDLADHALAARVFSSLAEEAEDSVNAGYFAGTLDYEERHAAIIQRFGRYPHRNLALGRESSAEELAFLEGPDSSFQGRAGQPTRCPPYQRASARPSSPGERTTGSHWLRSRRTPPSR